MKKPWHAVYLKSQMKLCNEYIAAILDSHRNSVDSWIHSYMEGLDALHYKPQDSELAACGEVIKEKLSDENIQTTHELSHRIFELTGISRGLT